MQTNPCRFVQLLATLTLLFSLQVAAQDPTRPHDWQAGQSTRVSDDTNLVLTQLVVSADTQRALINNQWLTVGDTLAGYSVSEIGANQVILRSNQEQRVLKLFQPLNVKNNESQGDQE